MHTPCILPSECSPLLYSNATVEREHNLQAWWRHGAYPEKSVFIGSDGGFLFLWDLTIWGAVMLVFLHGASFCISLTFIVYSQRAIWIWILVGQDSDWFLWSLSFSPLEHCYVSWLLNRLQRGQWARRLFGFPKIVPPLNVAKNTDRGVSYEPPAS